LRTLNQTVTDLLAIEGDVLLRPDLQSQGLSFSELQAEIDGMLRLLTRVSSCDLRMLPDNRFNDCNRAVSEIATAFGRLRSFSPSRANAAPVNEWQTITQQCKNIWTEATDTLSGIFAISLPTLAESHIEVRAVVDDISAKSQSTLAEITARADRARADVESTLEAVREATSAIAIEKQAEVFRNAASEHLAASRRWLNGTLCLAAIVLLALGLNWYIGYLVGPPSGSLPLLQLTIAKVLLFSFLLSAVVWAGRGYRAHQHNYVVNKHRQNALETFQLFVRGTGDSEIKNMVLLQATKSIFAPQSTGFLPDGEKEGGQGSPQILEIIRGLASSK